MSTYDIDPAACRGRQQRLIAAMQEAKIDLAIITRVEHVQWLVGPRFAWIFEPAAALTAEGHCLLIAPNKPPQVAAADEVETYDASLHSTLRNDQRHESSAVMLRWLADRPPFRTVAVEFSSCGPCLTQSLDAELVDLEPILLTLRRRKDPDELARIHRAIAATEAMYLRAREIIEPGLNELSVFNELQSAAVRELGEMLTGTGNDYACGEPGGPPRNRQIESGELYILDLGPAFRGYFADNCRTIAVNRRPTAEQHQAWNTLTEVFPLVEQRVRPGVSCRELFNEVQRMLDAVRPGAFNHHLGHGIGLFPHEAPHLNPHWDDVFEVGDVFTVEPGMYAPELRGGIRLENNYLVTETGVELLSEFELGL